MKEAVTPGTPIELVSESQYDPRSEDTHHEPAHEPFRWSRHANDGERWNGAYPDSKEADSQARVTAEASLDDLTLSTWHPRHLSHAKTFATNSDVYGLARSGLVRIARVSP